MPNKDTINTYLCIWKLSNFDEFPLPQISPAMIKKHLSEWSETNISTWGKDSLKNFSVNLFITGSLFFHSQSFKFKKLNKANEERKKSHLGPIDPVLLSTIHDTIFQWQWFWSKLWNIFMYIRFTFFLGFFFYDKTHILPLTGATDIIEPGLLSSVSSLG